MVRDRNKTVVRCFQDGVRSMSDKELQKRIDTKLDYGSHVDDTRKEGP